jgi:hypothetical protein
VLVGHSDCHHRPQIPQLHAQLPKFDSAVRRKGYRNCRRARLFSVDAIYGHYFDRVIPTGGKQILARSVQRYIAAVNGAYDKE